MANSSIKPIVKKVALASLIIGFMIFAAFYSVKWINLYIDEAQMHNWIKIDEKEEFILVSSEFTHSKKRMYVKFKSGSETLYVSKNYKASEAMKAYKYNGPFCMEVLYHVLLKERTTITKKSTYYIHNFKPAGLENCTDNNQK